MKKNILFIGPFSPPITGNSLVNDKIFDHLSNKTSFKVKKINTAYPEFNEETGIFSITKLLFYLKTNLQLHKQFRAQIVYISIGQTFLGVLKNVLPMLFSKLGNQKLIIHLHGNELGNNYLKSTYFQKKIFKFLLQLPDQAIVLSDNLKHNMQHFLEDQKIEVLPNFADIQIIASQNDINQKDYSKLKLIFLGNLMTEKGIFELLQALKSLQEKNIFIPTALYGSLDKKLKSKILSFVESLGDQVCYKGIVTGLEKKKAFLNNNVFILPSYNEGMPLAILEAMATGNLIISTDLPGLKDILITRENSFLIPAKNVDAIEKTLEKIYHNPAVYIEICKQNYTYVLETFSEEKFNTKLTAILNKL